MHWVSMGTKNTIPLTVSHTSGAVWHKAGALLGHTHTWMDVGLFFSSRFAEGENTIGLVLEC